MLRKIRITLASVLCAGLLLVFLDFTGTLHHWFAWIAKLQFWEALMAGNLLIVTALVVLTLIFGRIYCSTICPLGTLQDVVAHQGRKGKRNRYTYSAEKRWLRYGMLAIFLLAAALGAGSLVALLAPYSTFGLIATNILQPIYEGINNLLAMVAERLDSYAFYRTDIWLRSLSSLLIAAVLLLLIGFLAYRNGRTYCNTICPVGTLLSFASRFSWLKIRIDAEKCRNCSLCTKNCKASCIDFKNHKVDYSRCVVCGNCVDVCNHGAIAYCAPLRRQTTKTASAQSSEPAVDKSKRSFLMATALLATGAMAQEAKKVDGGLAEIIDKKAPTRRTPLTPPGSLSAENLAHRCTGCQLCISECPNDVLRPSSNLLSLMQPTMSYERGFCRPECNRCSEVCPAGAIKPIAHEEKSAIQIGHAVWVKANCLPLTDGVACGNCARHCPSGAIEMVPFDDKDESSPMIPVVNESACIGCGACENLCPARPFSAIYVEGHEVHRHI